MSLWLGKTVKHDVLNSFGLLVLQGGTVLTERSLQLLEKHRIDPAELSYAEPSLLSTVGDSPYDQLFRETIMSSEELFDYAKRTNKVPLSEFQKRIVPGIHEVSLNPDLFQLFRDIRGKDTYTYEHNIAVGVLANMIGMWLQLPEADIQHLALAATLHDVGKVNIPDEILQKPGKLTEEEYKLIQKHTIFGYDILKNTEGTSHRTALVALQHHEREDGKGYPFGIRGDKIDFFAKIVAIVDIFHAMSSRRPYHEPLPFQQVIDRMKSGSFGELQPNIVHMFMRRLAASIIGNQVKLSDGRIGEIIYLSPNEDEMKPIVKVEGEFVDLKVVRHLHIVDVYGSQTSAKGIVYETECGTWFGEDDLMEVIDWFAEREPLFQGLNGRQYSYLRQLLLDYLLGSPTREVPQVVLESMSYERRIEMLDNVRKERLQDYAG
ncbi:HD-GYP domain-containing protein [Paenibacillus chartarius]|uniref:HD-GYP domain-containing protein n=1 Tax=Paenibacillus chartarius TaxID=747481 RepID=A0ABV6DEP4_9BACL